MIVARHGRGPRADRRRRRSSRILAAAFREDPSSWVLPWAVLPEVDYAAGGAPRRARPGRLPRRPRSRGTGLVDWGGEADLRPGERARDRATRRSVSDPWMPRSLRPPSGCVPRRSPRWICGTSTPVAIRGRPRLIPSRRASEGMDFRLSAEQEEFRRTVARFVDAEVAPVAQRARRGGGVPARALPAPGRAGVPRPSLPRGLRRGRCGLRDLLPLRRGARPRVDVGRRARRDAEPHGDALRLEVRERRAPRSATSSRRSAERRSRRSP